MSSLFILALFSGCANDEIDDSTHDTIRAIGFNAENMSNTRANNAETAESLGRKFTVFGQKADGTNVFGVNGYEVTYATNEWTYDSATGQTLQYWDFSASKYTFTAYSLGEGDKSSSPATYANTSIASIDGFTLTGTKAQLINCYFTDKQIVDDYNVETVNLKFNQLAAKVRIGFWEAIEGYSVKDVKFFSSENATNTSGEAVLYAKSNVFPSDGCSYTISYDIGNKAKFVYSGTSEQMTSYISVGSLQQGVIGTSIENCTKTDFVSVLPMSFSESIYIRVVYTLVKDDGSSQEKNKIVEIKTKNNPKWDYQCQYTLVFEITLEGIKGLLITDEWDNDYRH